MTTVFLKLRRALPESAEENKRFERRTQRNFQVLHYLSVPLFLYFQKYTATFEKMNAVTKLCSNQ